MSTSAEQLAVLLKYGTATIHEAQGQTGALDSGLKPLDPSFRVIGPALTVDCPPADNLALHVALLHAKPGQVLVVDAKGFTEGGAWGDILSLAAKTAGIVGMVIDGAVRDSDSIVQMGFPIFSRAVSIKGTGKAQSGRINGTIVCGGVSIQPGDLIVGDRDGVVTVAPERLEEVIRLSEERERKEEELRTAIRAGKTTVELLGLEKLASGIK